MLHALIWPFDWSFSGFCFVFLLLLMYCLWALAQAAKGIGKMAKSALENEHVQEAGKGVFQAWLESTFTK